MGWDPSSLPESVRSKMDSSDRKPLGKLAMTSDEAEAKRQKVAEKTLHETFSQWLNMKQLPYVHCRMDKPATIRKGWPDFTITYQGRVLFVEFKADGGSLSADQETVIGHLTISNNTVLVTTDAGEAIKACISHFGLV